MADNRYYVVEARFPIKIDKAISVEEAARKAARIMQRDIGIDISNWFMRVFVYGDSQGDLGPVEEWFANPSGSQFRKVDQNFDKHQYMIDNNEVPTTKKDKTDEPN
jgi:hypothetical protein